MRKYLIKFINLRQKTIATFRTYSRGFFSRLEITVNFIQVKEYALMLKLIFQHR